MIGTVGKVFEKNILTIKHISRWRMRWVGQFITSVLELQENKESQKLCQNFSLLQVPLTKLWSRMLMIVKAGYQILIYCYQGRLIIKYVQLIKKIRLVVVSLHKHLLSNLSLPHPKCHVKCQKAPPIIHGQLLLFLVANVITFIKQPKLLVRWESWRSHVLRVWRRSLPDVRVSWSWLVSCTVLMSRVHAEDIKKGVTLNTNTLPRKGLSSVSLAAVFSSVQQTCWPRELVYSSVQPCFGTAHINCSLLDNKQC